MTNPFEVVCPTNGERIEAELSGGELQMSGDIRRVSPETEIWWSDVVRDYALMRDSNPGADPSDLCRQVLRKWQEEPLRSNRPG